MPFLNKHKGICGCFYRLFVSPYLSRTKKQLINQIEAYKKALVSIAAKNAPIGIELSLLDPLKGPPTETWSYLCCL